MKASLLTVSSIGILKLFYFVFELIPHGRQTCTFTTQATNRRHQRVISAHLIFIAEHSLPKFDIDHGYPRTTSVQLALVDTNMPI